MIRNHKGAVLTDQIKIEFLDKGLVFTDSDFYIIALRVYFEKHPDCNLGASRQFPMEANRHNRAEGWRQRWN
jgi:hypothetical protein